MELLPALKHVKDMSVQESTYYRNTVRYKAVL